MSTDDTAADLARIISRLLYGDDGTVGPDTPVLEDGMMSSINMIEVVAEIEARFKVVIPAPALYGPDFATPRALAALVHRLQAEGAP